MQIFQLHVHPQIAKSFKYDKERKTSWDVTKWHLSNMMYHVRQLQDAPYS